MFEQAVVSMKRGAYLLKYGRRGKPKFCPFRLSTVDFCTVTWYQLFQYVQSSCSSGSMLMKFDGAVCFCRTLLKCIITIVFWLVTKVSSAQKKSHGTDSHGVNLRFQTIFYGILSNNLLNLSTLCNIFLANRKTFVIA